jgi:hypothetical protein
MLFDLRGRGRRRTVQVIYLGLAILIGVGLVGFGIGGGFGGQGLLNAVGNNSGGGGTSFDARIKADVKLTRQQPANPQAWANLISDDFRQAGTGANYDSNASQFTSHAQGVLNQAADAWQHYLALSPQPNPDLAREMVIVYSGPGALNQPSNNVRALEILIAAQPNNEQNYLALAQSAYQSGNKRQGDLAAAKAVSLAPAAQQPTLRQELAALKANPKGTSSTAASGSTTPTVVNLPSTSTSATSSASHKK